MASRAQAGVVLILSLLTTGSIAESQSAIDLQFRPEIGRKQATRVNWRVATSYQGPLGAECTEHVKTYILETEPLALAHEGGATVRVRIRRIVEDTIRHYKDQNDHLWKFDSAGVHQYNMSMGKYVAFLGETFTIDLNAQGQVVAMDTDDFYAGIGKKRLRHEDEALLHNPNHARALAAINRLNDQYGSPQKRALAYAEAAPTNYLYGVAALQRILSYALAPLPTEPVKPGDRWTAPVQIYLEGPMEMDGTHTFQGIEENVCTIQVEANRTLTDKPSPEPDGRLFAEKLEGTYRAVLTVDQTSGWPRSRNATMSLTGHVAAPGPPTTKPRPQIPVTVEAAVTAEPLQ